MSSLRGVKPSLIEKRFKAFFYGSAGAGKTMAAIQFPFPYLIDTEKGAENDDYVRLLEKSKGVIFQTSDFEEIITEVKSLMTETHLYKTIIIDPLTTIYNNLIDKYENSLKGKSTAFAKHYQEANKRMKHLYDLLMRLDMNVIITSHAKKEYGENMQVLGQTFDCPKKFEYFFDLIIEVQKRGKDRVGITRKSRFEEKFPEDETFKFSYDEIAKRYGKESLERDCVSEKLATQEQIIEVNRLITLLNVPEETYKKWLDKSKSNSFDEMPSENIQKCIEFLNLKIEGNSKNEVIRLIK